ncbi:Asp23/Gls24 family envelope stress response protein [Streptomyces sp. NPDC088762]|uniref:Asp23/Gls24 family envelope stress response protein n=1 Tax=Streptomyces sp. NPDC088762 TaxID=3365891 RepID=UPI003830CFBC
MTSAPGEDVRPIAARAALEVPGVAALQPVLADRLAAAASRLRHGAGAAPQPVAGIRAERVSEDGWHVEVRCMLYDGRRVADVARQVCEHVQAAVTTHLVRLGSPATVSVRVTVTRTLVPA